MLTILYGIILLSFCYFNHATPLVIISTFGGVILLKILITKITFANNMNNEKIKKRIEKSNSGNLVKNGINLAGSLFTGNPGYIVTSLGQGLFSFFNDGDTNRSVITLDVKELSKVQNTSFNILFLGMLTDYFITLLVLMYPDQISTYLTDLFNSNEIAKSAIEGLSQGEDWK